MPEMLLATQAGQPEFSPWSSHKDGRTYSPKLSSRLHTMTHEPPPHLPQIIISVVKKIKNLKVECVSREPVISVLLRQHGRWKQVPEACRPARLVGCGVNRRDHISIRVEVEDPYLRLSSVTCEPVCTHMNTHKMTIRVDGPVSSKSKMMDSTSSLTWAWSEMGDIRVGWPLSRSPTGKHFLP